MAKEYYQNFTPQERLDKIGRLVSKAVYLYHQKINGNIKEVLQEKEESSISDLKGEEKTAGENKTFLSEKIFTIKDATEFLKISRTTFWRLKKHGGLPYCMIGNGRLIRFKLSEILNYVETKRS